MLEFVRALSHLLVKNKSAKEKEEVFFLLIKEHVFLAKKKEEAMFPRPLLISYFLATATSAPIEPAMAKMPAEISMLGSLLTIATNTIARLMIHPINITP
jgi:hypothetical protein